MRIGVITYDHPHRKTQDLLWQLYLMGYIDVEVIATQWKERKNHKPLYQHRPNDAVHVPLEDLCNRMNIALWGGELEDVLSMERYDTILIAGAGILPPEVLKYNIINSHPGYLPNVRGLDALKWAILKDEPIGVTTYFIGEEPDTGTMIGREIIDIYYTDTFHSIAQRVYELEIKMLVDAIETKPDGKQLKAKYPATRRMSPLDEMRMITRLNERLKKL